MSPRIGSRICASIWLLLACLVWLPARADTALSQFQSFRGNINFTGTEATLRSGSNSRNPCGLVQNGIVSAVLQGIPSGATVLSAQLYWAASGNSVDATVSMDGNSITAVSSRRYTSSTVGYNYFSAAADVTSYVAKKGNATYTFSGLSVSNGSPWCDVQGVVGGFALVVVYSIASEPFRMLNIYEGFQYFRNNGFTINLGNFNVPNPLPSNVTGRVGHITWEGDPDLSGGGENLLFNDNQLTDSMNPAGNQFNSASNITGDTNSYGVDFDVYTLTSPVIQGGQTSATTTYQTGQDMVILSAEVVAMPYVANADLALTMTRNGDLSPNSTASYVLSVTNNGIDTELGPVTIVDTVPSGLKAVSYSGSGWTCSAAAGSNGTTIVTCTANGPVNPGATMNALTLNVTASATGNYTNTATVSGKTGDNNSSNNSASNTQNTTPASSSVTAVFTREACKNNDKIVVLASDAGCHVFTGPVTAARTDTVIYVTAVSSNGGVQTATAPSTSDATIPLDFMASCLPTSGITAAYAGLNLDCKGGWQTANVQIKANQPTIANVASFVYNDVGRISLSVRYNGAVLGNRVFISRPADIRVRDVVRSDGYSDQGGAKTNANGAYWKPDIGFVKAGEAFTLRLCAWMANNACAPSFGKEAAQLQGVMDSNTLAMKFTFDAFAVTSPQASPGSAVTPITTYTSGPDTITGVDALVAQAFAINQDFAPGSIVTGTVVEGTMDAGVSYVEAGNLALTPSLGGYLGTDPVTSQPTGVDITTAARLGDSTRVIGRFYPDHFVTNLDQAFDCLPAMNCPAAYSANPAAWPLSGGVYARQPFTAHVTAYGVSRNGQPSLLNMFQNLASTGRTALAMSAVAAPNDTTSAAPAGTLSSLSMPAPANATDFPPLADTATYALPPNFDAAARLANNWGAPQRFYLRAAMTETTRTAASPNGQKVTVNSVAPASAAAGTQYEDGLLAVNGRLQIANVTGSDVLRLPVTLTAQYWNGSTWLINGNDNASQVAATMPVATPAPVCTKALASSGTTCKTSAVTSVNGSTALTLNAGKATMVLQGPGRGNVGSIDYQVGGGAAAGWLPSTRARATFGLYKSPVIYLREVY